MTETNIDDDGSGIITKQKDRKLYNQKYHETYGNKHNVVSAPCIKDAIIHQVYSGRKRKVTCFVYIQVSPYRDGEGSSQIRSCTCYAKIIFDQRIGGKFSN